jgi:hypothetical protein
MSLVEASLALDRDVLDGGHYHAFTLTDGMLETANPGTLLGNLIIWGLEV